jgi:methylated-DNA-[protein]-cysteine S-methyltransferase
MKAKTPQTQSLEIPRSLAAWPPAKAPATLLPAVLRRVGLVDRYWRMDSPIGPVFVARSKTGISMVLKARSAAEFEREFFERRGRVAVAGKGAAPAELRALLPHRKTAHRPKPRVDLRGVSEFERAVLLKALEIPPGEVRPYSWIAREIGHPAAVRATGTALAKNPIPLVIPCHRVVRSDGHIGNYSMGGSSAKRRLLEVEGAEPATLERLAESGVRYLGNEERRFYCFPTCGGVQSLVRANRIRFASEREAVAAGYHPCEDCRPAA